MSGSHPLKSRTPAPRRRMAATERRAQLLEAAGRLVSRNGLSGVTMERLAAEASVSKALVYLHFENTSEVLLALMRQEHERLDAQVVAGLAAAGTFHDRVLALIRPYFEAVARRDSLFRRLVVERSDRDLLERWQRERNRSVIGFLTDEIVGEFEIPLADAELAAAALLGAFEATTVHWWSTAPADRARIEETFMLLVEGALDRLTEGRRGGRTKPALAGGRSRRQVGAPTR